MALWTPANLSGSKLHRWIKGTSFTTSGGTITGGTTSDSSASTITKISTNWPSYNSSGLNGHPTITSGGDNLMSIPVDIDYDCSVVTVIKPSALGSHHNVYELSGDKCPMLWIDNSNRFSMNGAGSVIEPSSPTANGSTWRVISTINRSSGTRSEERIDGTGKGTAGESVGALNVGTGLTLKLLGRSSGNGLQGDVAEIVVTYGALTTDDEARIEGYLAWRYGLQSQLDSGHAYKSAAPTDGSSDGTGAADGVSTVAGTGATHFAGTGSAAGSAITSGVGSAASRGTGATIGTAVAAGVSASWVAAQGSASGVGAASATGASSAAGVGAASGASIASGIGDAVSAGVATGSAHGVSSVSGYSVRLLAALATPPGRIGGRRRPVLGGAGRRPQLGPGRPSQRI